MHVHLLNMLATWRLTELLVEERGFYAIFDKVREYANNREYADLKEAANNSGYKAQMPMNSDLWHEVSQMLSCRYCTSVTVGIALAIVTRQNVLYGFAYSAGALMFGRVFERIEA